ncbi:MAG: RHS repeat-associated core domain-containing protein [Verrucomicrobiota bacterium]|nr:RHS repeat-associated core domain-containing protein [Verrucomicrobiota bacterium]
MKPKAFYSAFLPVIVILVLSHALNAGNYWAPNLPEADLASPFTSYANDPITNVTLSQLETLVASPSVKTRTGKFTDLQKFLTYYGTQSFNVALASNDIEKFNLALAMAVNWTRDIYGPSGKNDNIPDLRNYLGTFYNVYPIYYKYLSPTLETQFNLELAQLAEKLNYNPIEIYNWVYSNIEFEDYELSRKGALSTYLTRKGNEYDQCSLLIALYRLSGFPARYVTGHQYESNPALPNQESLKDVVIAQVWISEQWLNASIKGNYSDKSCWVSLVPWFKSIQLQQGIDLFHSWVDTNNNQIPDPGEVTTSINSKWRIDDYTKDDTDYSNQSYLWPQKPLWTDPLSVAKFKNHIQQNSVEYFEQVIQNKHGSLNDIPFRQLIKNNGRNTLPLSLPIELCSTITGPGSDIATASIYEITPSDGVLNKYPITTPLGETWIYRDSNGGFLYNEQQWYYLPNSNPKTLWEFADSQSVDFPEGIYLYNQYLKHAEKIDSVEIECKPFLSHNNSEAEGYAEGYWNFDNGDGKGTGITADWNLLWEGGLTLLKYIDDSRFDFVAKLNADRILKLSNTGLIFGKDEKGIEEGKTRSVSFWFNVGPDDVTGKHILYEEGGKNLGNGLATRLIKNQDGSTSIQTKLNIFNESTQKNKQFSDDYLFSPDEKWHHYAITIRNTSGWATMNGVYQQVFALQMDTYLDGINIKRTISDDKYVYKTVNAGENIGGAAIGGTNDGDVFDEPLTSDRSYFKGMIDEIRIYNSYHDLDFVRYNLYGGNILSKKDNNRLYLPQIASRRLNLQIPILSENINPKLYLDGILFNENKYTNDNAIASKKLNYFHFAYRFANEKYWNIRPPVKVHGLVWYGSFDMLAASENYSETLIDNVVQHSAMVGLENAYGHGAYLGQLAKLILEKYESRNTTAFYRLSELMGFKNIWKDRKSFTQVWTYLNDDTGIPANNPFDDFSPFRMPIGWRIDARIQAADTYSIKYPLLKHTMADPLGYYYNYIAGATASLNESRIFEDIQGTPALSTVAGLFSAIADPDNDVLVLHSNSKDQIESLLEYVSTSNVEAKIVNEVTDKDATVLVPKKNVSIMYPVGHPNQNTPAIVTDVRFTSIPPADVSGNAQNQSLLYSFGQFNGGKSDEQTDFAVEEKTTPAKVYDVAIINFKGSNSFLLQQATLKNAQEDFVNVFRVNIETRAIYSGGDPVDLVSGEYWLEEPADIFVRSRGLNLQVTRKYKSQLIYNGPFGFGWTWNHAESLLFANYNNVDYILYYDSDRRPLGITKEDNGTYKGPNGSTFEFKLENQQYVLTEKNGNKTIFNKSGFLLEKSDMLGNKLKFEYGPRAQIRSIIDTLGRKLLLDYNQDDHVTRITDFTGRSVYYTYDNSTSAVDIKHDLIAFTDLDSYKWEYIYYTNQENPLNNHNLKQRLWPSGEYLNIFYYKNDTVSHHTNSLGNTFRFQYSWINRYSETWTENGFYQKIFYNENWDVTRIQKLDKSVEYREYDDKHNMVASIDGNGNKTRYKYDNSRNLIQAISLLSEPQDNIKSYKVWIFEYDYNNRRTLEIDPSKTVSRFFYNSKGQMISAEAAIEVADYNIDNEGNISTDITYENAEDQKYDTRGTNFYVYDDYGNLIKESKAYGTIHDSQPQSYYHTYHSYDINGLNKVKTINPRGYETTYQYDDLGQVVAVIDPEGNVTQTEYTKSGAPSKIIGPDGAVTLYTYAYAVDDVDYWIGTKAYIANTGQKHRLLRTTLPNGAKQLAVYCAPFYSDHKERILREVDAYKADIKREYDESGRLITTTDRLGFTNEYYYDAADNLIESIDPLGNSTRYDYDGNGNRILVTNAKGNSIRYHYNPDNRLAFSEELWGTHRKTKFSYEYDTNCSFEYKGDIQSDYNDYYRTVTSYDKRGHVNNTYTIRDSDNSENAIKYTYDSLGRIITETNVGYSTCGDLTTTYFKNQMHGEKKKSYSYDANGNVISTTIYDADTLSDPRNNSNVVTYFNSYNSRDLIEKSIDGNGHVTYYEYDAAGRLISKWITVTAELAENNTISTKQETKITYDLMGNKVREQQFVDTSTSTTPAIPTEVSRMDYTYDLMNRLISQTDMLGNTTKYRYDAAGNKIETTDPLGYTKRSYYDAMNRVVATENELRETTYFEYDELGNTIAIINPLNERVIQKYNENNELVEVVDPLGNRTRHYYDKFGRKILTADPRFSGEPNLALQNPAPYTTKFEYLFLDLLKKTITPVRRVDGYPSNIETENYYDGLGRLWMQKDPRGIYTEYFYDALDKVNLLKQAKGTLDEVVTKNEYDGNGNLLFSTQAFGTSDATTTSYEYDELNRQVKTTLGVNNTLGKPTLESTVVYLDAQRQVKNKDAYGVETTTTFDSSGRKVALTDSNNNSRTWQYSPRGELVKELFPSSTLDYPIKYFYDPAGRLIDVTRGVEGLADYQRSTTFYDAKGQVVEAIDPKGISNLTYYDANGRKIRSVEAAGTADQAITKFSYDAAGNLLKIVDANHAKAYAWDIGDETAIATYQYDELNRIVKKTDADGTFERIVYDGNGNQVEIYKRGAILGIGKGYDNLNRLTGVWFNNLTLQQFFYDKLSRLTKATDYNNNEGYSTGVHSVEYAYDFANRVEVEKWYDAENAQGVEHRIVQTVYEKSTESETSQKITKTYAFGGYIFPRTYDDRGLLKAVNTTDGKHLATFFYDPMGRPVSAQWFKANDVLSFSGALYYDTYGREVYRDYIYSLYGSLYGASNSYDLNGNLQSETIVGDVTVNAGEKIYSHDNRNRLTYADYSGSSGSEALSWNYDAVGNWKETNQNNPPSTESRTVNSDNEYVTIGAQSPGYDYEGNLSNYDGNNYYYDWANRLVQVSNGSTIIAKYTYDAANRLIKKNLVQSGKIITYVYDGDQVIQELENDSLKRTYTYAGGIDTPLSLHDQASGTIYFYLRDRQGSIVALVNRDGVTAETYEYTPFGQMTIFNPQGNTVSVSALGNTFGFTGRIWDADIRLWNYRNRFYSPFLGRFLQRDPAGFIDGYNIYAYVINNPLRYMDPYGLKKIPIDEIFDAAKKIGPRIINGRYAGKTVDATTYLNNVKKPTNLQRNAYDSIIKQFGNIEVKYGLNAVPIYQEGSEYASKIIPVSGLDGNHGSEMNKAWDAAKKVFKPEQILEWESKGWIPHHTKGGIQFVDPTVHGFFRHTGDAAYLRWAAAQMALLMLVPTTLQAAERADQGLINSEYQILGAAAWDLALAFNVDMVVDPPTPIELNNAATIENYILTGEFDPLYGIKQNPLVQGITTLISPPSPIAASFQSSDYNISDQNVSISGPVYYVSEYGYIQRPGYTYRDGVELPDPSWGNINGAGNSVTSIGYTVVGGNPYDFSTDELALMAGGGSVSHSLNIQNTTVDGTVYNYERNVIGGGQSAAFNATRNPGSRNGTGVPTIYSMSNTLFR